MKEATPYWQAAGLTSTGTFEACLGRGQMSRSPQSPARILVYGEAFTGWSHRFGPDGLNTVPSQAASRRTAPTVGRAGRVPSRTE